MEKLESYCTSILQDLATYTDDDPINDCGKNLLNLILKTPDEAISSANEWLHTFPFSSVEERWKRLYTDASITKAVYSILGQVQRSKVEQTEILETWLSEIVKNLDMPLIMTGAPRREAMIHKLFVMLEDYSEDGDLKRSNRKRRKISDSFPDSTLRHPELIYPMPHVERTLYKFSTHLSSTNPNPTVITSTLKDWPACKPGTWDSPSYLLSKTFDGRRLVPIELGTSYTSDDFGQAIIPFREYIEKHLISPNGEKMSYLAQHDLFTQIPALRKDILIPEFCSVSPHCVTSLDKDSENLQHIKNSDIPPSKAEPLIKAWLGPAGTLSPLHTDPYHNILAQVVGCKYVRLYPPSETPKLYPRGVNDEGIDLSNTSQIPVELVEMTAQLGEECDGDFSEDESAGEAGSENEEGSEELFFPHFSHAKYVETILKEGECLYIPVGWWHYVRSLSTSFSVSFWWK